MTNSMATASSMLAALAAIEEIPETGLVNSRFGAVKSVAKRPPLWGSFCI